MTPYSILLSIVLGIAFVLLAGCKTLPTQTPSSAIATTVIIDPAPYAAKIAANDFNILGRIAVQDNDQSFFGSFRWRHSDKLDEILLFTPLGQAVAEITRDADGVRLITTKLEAYYAESAEQLTEEILGWRLPLNGLQYWIQGAHSPYTSAEKDLGAENQLLAIRQDGWHIHYARFSEKNSQAFPLPKQFHLFYENERLKIRVVVDDWHVQN